MNLLHDPWMPVRDAQGRREWITPDRLAEPQWRAFDADRPDFNGALAQFAIGLLQTTTPVADSIGWRELFREAPDPATLRDWFTPVTHAFNLDGEGPRFMQDQYLKTADAKMRDDDSGRSESIQNLLIDTAGESEKAEDNTDHFVKRKGAQFGLCPQCTAIALFALQVNAPGGGRGYLVSIRGGGPLTTLVQPAHDATLWQALWLNVTTRSGFDSALGRYSDGDIRFTFPWMTDLRFLQPAGITTVHFEGPRGGPKPTEDERPRVHPSQVHPAHVFWAMPRRLNVDFQLTHRGECGVCTRGCDRLFSRFAIKNYGLNYKGDWIHPLSPYYKKDSAWLPVHPQDDGLGYRHWLAWALGSSESRSIARAAEVVSRATQLPDRTTGGPLRLWAFGYDMDNMKACCWYEATMPLYELGACDRDSIAYIQTEVGRWINAAEVAVNALKSAVKDAWFTPDPKRKKSPVTRKLGYVSAAFWNRTGSTFYTQLHALIEATRSDVDQAALPAREAWHRALTHAALHLFDHAFVGAGAIERQNPRRIALAHKQLRARLFDAEMKLALGLPTYEPAKKAGRKRAATQTTAAQEAA